MREPLSFTPQLLFEDNHLLVVEKPVNLLSQADHSGSPDLLSLLKDWIKQRDQKPGQVFLGLVQRLDRPVGGVMVFAKTSKAASRLADQVRQRTLQKTYLAVGAGVIDPPEGTLTDWLEKNHHNNTVRVVESGLPQPSKRFSTMSGLPFMQTRPATHSIGNRTFPPDSGATSALWTSPPGRSQVRSSS